MTSKVTINLLSALFVIFCAFVGTVMSEEFFTDTRTGFALGLIFGLIVVLIDRLLKGFSLRAFSSATFGLVIGLLFATLLRASDMLKFQSERVQWVVSLGLYAAFGYLGMMLAMRSNREEFSLIIPYVRFTGRAAQDSPLIIDTNVVIDGRIADLCASGFLSRQLIVPRFVLDELQRLADSSDAIRRARGKRGLDNLNALQADRNVSLTIHEHELDRSGNVDAALVRVAQVLQARIVTNDASLGKAATLQGVVALNLNELSKAMRSVVVPGDELEIDLVKEGRDPGQAVGYLVDGTMIVVNGASKFIGTRVHVTVAGALQTSAGRLFFAELTVS
jgi:uncharacterized protein YacL